MTRKLFIQRYMVKLPDIDKEQIPTPPPSFSSHFRFSYKCTYCHHELEMFQPVKGVYTEADMLKMAKQTFEFANQKCGHGQKEPSKKVPT